jgi:glycosyltransferase involved in cell wall biosynthesis
VSKPLVSVVMAVFNGADSLHLTMQSVIDQIQNPDEIELIIVNDGSTDETGQIVDQYAAQYDNIRVYHQENQGLTRSLIFGCGAARGRYIARQDCGDLSLPGRFAAQAEQLEQDPGVSMVSTGTVFVGPLNEEIYTVIQDNSEATTGLKNYDLKSIKGPSIHGSVMFRKSDYEKVGGYREPFYVAQDLDLWTRLVEVGNHFSIEKVFYQAILEKNSITSRHKKAQVEMTEIIFQCCRARALNGDDSDILKKMASNQQLQVRDKDTGSERLSDARFYYFLGATLGKTDPASGIGYLKKSLARNPANIKVIIKLLQLKMI